MRRLKAFGLAFLAIAALAVITAASASAILPDIHLLPTEASKAITGEGTIAKASVAILESELGTKVEADELKVLLGLTPLTALGLYDLHFVKVKLIAESCSSEGDAAGVVLAKGEFHLVFVGLSPTTTLAVGVLLLFGAAGVKFKCGKVSFTVKGAIVVSFKGLNEVNNDITEFDVNAKCVKPGFQDLTSYEDENGNPVTKQLPIVEVPGLEPENGCETLKEQVKIKMSNMISVLL
jgi:hypothetical protein